jgi:ubiquinone/menaquinone biosynthesis C-methylase UbiE
MSVDATTKEHAEEISMSSKPYFDDVAQQWDTLRQSFFSENVRTKALAVAGVHAGESAADIGAGTGFITQGLVSSGLKVIAVDPSSAMLETMKTKFSGHAEIEYRTGEAEHLPIANEVVDYVFANMCLHHVETPAEAIKEMTRVLKPGGKLIITDLDEHTFEFLRTEQHDRWMGFKREDVLAWLNAAGLHDAAVDCVGENCCAQSSCGCQQATVSIFVASGSK